MHILIIPSWYPNSYDKLNGIFFKEQAEALAKREHKIGVIALSQVTVHNIKKEGKFTFSNRDFIENNVTTYLKEYPILPRLHRTLNICQSIKKFHFKKLFKKYIEKEGLPDIVHLHSFSHGDLAMWIKEIYNVPFIVTEHTSAFSRNLLSPKEIIFAKKVFQSSSKNLAVSKQFASLLRNITECTFEYLPNIVNTGFFDCNKKQNSNSFQFINIANLLPNKNHKGLIKAFKQSFGEQKNINLLIVGDGSEYSNLQKLIIEQNLSDQVSLFGLARRKEVKDLLQQSDAFVLSSIYETFGVVIIEAMACGLPVVATRCGGPESIVANDKIGFLSEIDESNLSEKMSQLYDKKDKFDSDYIRQYVQDNFSEDAVCLKLEDVFNKALLK
jgi:glycosyltransferase involved in cell wall biosynthesis